MSRAWLSQGEWSDPFADVYLSMSAQHYYDPHGILCFGIEHVEKILCNANNPWYLSSSLDAVGGIHSEVLYVAVEQGRSGGW